MYTYKSKGGNSDASPRCLDLACLSLGAWGQGRAGGGHLGSALAGFLYMFQQEAAKNTKSRSLMRVCCSFCQGYGLT